VIESCPRVENAILFGSQAMSSHRYGPEINVALDRENLNINDLLKLRCIIDEMNLPFMVDLVHIQKISNTNLINHIQRVGKNLYCRENGL
jgi:hypothetical protein